jgi:hypothetical protein
MYHPPSVEGPRESTPELRQPTRAVPVRITLVGQNATPAELFLPNAGTSRTAVLDGVADIVDNEAKFFPFKWLGDVRLLGKHAIVWIAVHRQELDSTDALDPPSEVTTLYDRQHHVEVQLMSGSKLTGTLLDSSPANHPRVVDHINGSGQFMRLWTADEHFLINKAQILQVTELAWSID